MSQLTLSKQAPHALVYAALAASMVCMPIAAHVLARSCGQAFDEAVSFVVIMVRGRFKRRDVTSAYGYEHPAGRITRLSNVKADRH